MMKLLLSSVACIILNLDVNSKIGAVPLQWEQIQPIGNAPEARYSHTSVAFSSSQGIVYTFGGFSGLSLIDCRSGCTFYNDVWLLETSAQGWDEVTFQSSHDSNCGSVSPAAAPVLPTKRAEHAMVSCGSIALMCGGFTLGPTFLQDVNGQLECWWLTPLPAASWKPAIFQPSDLTGPSPRHGHSLIFDPESDTVLLFGGRDASFIPISDCWWLNATDPDPGQTYQWQPCSSIGPVAPSPRFGHGSAVFRSALYIVGGFVSDGLGGAVAQDDIWALPDYAGNGSWGRIMPASQSPGGRAYFGCWQSGFLLHVAGGEGSTATLQDTWSFNFYTKVWVEAASQDQALRGSRFSVALSDSRTAVSFGGRSAKGVAMGQLFAFTADTGWSSLLAAGDRPPRRSGHIAAYDSASDRMIIALGMDATEALVNDIWALDLASGAWTCLSGVGRACARQPASPPSGPRPRGFAATSQVGLHLFVFGGVEAVCASGQRSATVPSGELWALNIATVQWSLVQGPAAPGAEFGPSPRVMTAMVTYGRHGGLKAPLMMVGGANFDCFSAGCVNPTPQNDVWVIDAARAEMGRGEDDLAAEFDGNDLIEITLPKWCGLASSMGVLWIDLWMFLSSYPAVAGKPIMLIDAYANSGPVLRWYLEGASGSNGPATYVVLRLTSSLAESVVVKRWGPLGNSDLLEVWHHFAFTLRFARVSQQGSCNSPAVVLVQAHMFLDTEAVPAGNSFLSLDIEQLQLRSGINSFYIGGVSPDATDASSFLNFVGAMDNLRIWWPPCPADNDPSRCNPYAFIYPVLKDGSRLPSSGIDDDKVRLDYVARPLLMSILIDKVNASMGLIVNLDFNLPSPHGVLTDRSDWGGPPACPGTLMYSDVCPGCPPGCAFAFASRFDVSCLGSGLFSILEDSSSQEFYGNQGSCKCLDTDTCPTMVKNCECPQGLERVCTSCHRRDRPGPSTEAGICNQGDANICWTDADCAPFAPGSCARLDPRFCPEELCSSWDCACLRNGSSYALGQTARVAAGSGSCSCPESQSLQPMPIVIPGGALRYPCCSQQYLRGVICDKWITSWTGKGSDMRCDSSYAQVRLDGTQDCGIDSCCLTSGLPKIPSTPPGPTTPGTPQGPSASGGPTCTLTGLSQGTWIGTFASASGGPAKRSIDVRSVGGQGISTLSDVVFHGVFVPDSEEDGMDPNQDSNRKKPSMEGRHEFGSALHSMKEAAGREKLWTDADQGKRSTHSPSSRKLMQASDTLPAILTFKIIVSGKSCTSNPLLCTEKDLIINAIKTSAMGTSNINIKLQNIFLSSDCACIALPPVQNGPPNIISSSGNMTLNISLIIDSSTLHQNIDDGKLISANLHASGIAVQGLYTEISSMPTLAYCGDGIKQTQSSWVQVSDKLFYMEECDDGNSSIAGVYNSIFSRCSPACTCNRPGFKLDSDNETCVCQQNPSIFLNAKESNRVIMAQNEITLNLYFQDEYKYDYLNPATYQFGPLIVTISGLKGSLTSDGTINVSCNLPDFSFACGLEPDLGSEEFRTNKAVWSKENGELKFTVLKRFGPLAQPSNLDVKLILQNNMYAQDAVTPSIATCNRLKKRGQGYILSSNTIEIEGPKIGRSDFSIYKQDPQGSTFSLVNISLSPITQKTKVMIEAIQSSLAADNLIARLPVGAQFAGLISTAGLNYTSADLAGIGEAATPVNSNVSMTISFPVDRTIVRTQGGCVKSADSHVQICLPGYVGLYQFKYKNSAPSISVWENLTPINNHTMTLASVDTTVSATSVYAIIATSQCNDVLGSGRAGGDRICLMSTDLAGAAVSTLGGLSVSRMPVLSRSTRPAFASWADHSDYLKSSSSGSKYRSRMGWVRFCPGGVVLTSGDNECPSNRAAELSWFPARLGHSLAAVSPGRVIVFGGFACQSFDAQTSWCKELTLLSDVWELDVSIAMAGGDGLKRILLSPSPPGATGQASISLPDNSQRILIFGGASIAYQFLAVKHITPPPTLDSEVFVVRDILLRIGTSNSGTVETIGAKSSHSVVLADPKAIIFGGFARNTPTSATYTYDLDAVTPALGLRALFATAQGPPSRGYAGLGQMSEISLILFGGVTVNDVAGSCVVRSLEECCSTRIGLLDVWKLDLNSRQWTIIPSDLASPKLYSTAFGAFAYFTLQGTAILVLHGGIRCGYLPGITFENNCPYSSFDQDTDCNNQVSTTMQIMGVEKSSDGFRYRTWKYRKLTPSSATIPARCLHSLLLGPFLSSSDVGLVYGGLGKDGKALQDLWLVRSDLMQPGACFVLLFNVTTNQSEAVLSDFNGLMNIFSASPAGCSPDQRAGISFSCDINPVQVSGFSVVMVTATYLQFQSCIQPFLADPRLFRSVSLTKNSTWSSADLYTSYNPNTGVMTEVRFDVVQFQPISPARGCKSSCMGGFCYPPAGQSVSAPSKCYAGNDCSNNYTCSLPGSRHGHSMVLFAIAGRSVPLLFGGETTDINSKAPALSADLFSAFLEEGSASWVKFNLGYVRADGAEQACTPEEQAVGGFCPAPRRDAAVVLMGNTGGQNGRLLLFGGMTYCQPSAAARRTCSGSLSPVLSYLSGSISDAPMPLDDLWSLSLSRITLSCIRDGSCLASNRLLWARIPVASDAGPSSRWGAGISINKYTNELFLTGGTSVDSMGSYSERNELFSYQLTDAYYQACVASGDGLQNALAGQQASFTVACDDVFGQPASTASVFVSITGPVALSPTVNAVDGVTGVYHCTYTAGTIGTYGLEIRVGRGGTTRRELIPQGTYVLTVSPGLTSPAGSISAGDYLSLTTAGSIGSFTILARDSLGNRRPGKDEIDVLIYLKSDDSVLPVSGQVNDVGDGSYQVQYRITMAGSYSLHISFSGIVGAQTPIDLMVQSAVTDLTRTYGYGTVLFSAAGVTSSLYVQTRDSYGNNALVDPGQYPLGLEEISFEMCKSIGDDPTRACAGGMQEQSVSVTHAYGTGPPGSSDTAYGLYTLAYFPFTDGTFMPLVRHNSTVVTCLFDTSKLPAAVDPGPAEADACILQSRIEAASLFKNRRNAAPNIFTLTSQQSDRLNRRLAMSDKLIMIVNATFKEPNLQNAKYWSFLAPILAAVVGVIFDLCCGFIIPVARGRYRRIEDDESFITDNEHCGEGKPEKSSSKEMQGVISSIEASEWSREIEGDVRHQNTDFSSPIAPFLLPLRDDMLGISKEGCPAPPAGGIINVFEDTPILSAHSNPASCLVFVTRNSEEERLPSPVSISNDCKSIHDDVHDLPMPVPIHNPQENQVWDLSLGAESKFDS